MDKCCTKLHKSYQAGFIIPVSLYARYARCKRVQDHTMDAVAKTAATHNVQVCGRTLCNTQGLTTCCCRKHKASQRANVWPHNVLLPQTQGLTTCKCVDAHCTRWACLRKKLT